LPIPIILFVGYNMVVIHRKICRPILLIGTPHMPIFLNLFLYHDLFPDQIKVKP
jgi:hypothetical protein